MNTTLVGGHFRGEAAMEIIHSLTIGEPLELRREPDNEYDSAAIMVLKNGTHLGYIPKTDNSGLAQYMDDGGEVICLVVYSGPNINKPTLEVQFVDEGSLVA